ncbi:MAG: site-2 protease family protein [Roseicyclus sp.]
MWGRSITVMRLGGFDIKVDASWLVIAALIIWSLGTDYFPSVLPDATAPALLMAAAIAMLGLFASLILHELAHSVMARGHGLKISGITLFLFGGVAELETEPADPVTELRVAVVGPMASLLLAGVFWSSVVVARVLGLSAIVVAVLGYLSAINLTLAIFNMIPAYPLDGGRVYRALVWMRRGDLVGATRHTAKVSAVFAWGLIALGVTALFGAGAGAGLWPILVGLFLLALGRSAYQRVEVQSMFEGRVVADLMTPTPIVVLPGQSLAEVINRVFLAKGVSFAPVMEHHEIIGYVDLNIIRRIDREHWSTTTVEDVVEAVSDENTVPPDLRAQSLVDRIGQTGRRKYLVMDKGRLVGIVTLSDVTAYLDISRQIAAPA